MAVCRRRTFVIASYRAPDGGTAVDLVSRTKPRESWHVTRAHAVGRDRVPTTWDTVPSYFGYERRPRVGNCGTVGIGEKRHV